MSCRTPALPEPARRGRMSSTRRDLPDRTMPVHRDNADRSPPHALRSRGPCRRPTRGEPAVHQNQNRPPTASTTSGRISIAAAWLETITPSAPCSAASSELQQGLDSGLARPLSRSGQIDWLTLPGPNRRRPEAPETSMWAANQNLLVFWHQRANERSPCRSASHDPTGQSGFGTARTLRPGPKSHEQLIQGCKPTCRS